MNDPTGLVQWRGRYHVFYQHHPAAPCWGRMHWGHASSADLVDWTDHGLALLPSSEGPDHDGCWSGSIVVVDGTPVAFYTGAAGEGPEHRESVCRATSDDDLITWHKDPANPILPGDPGTGGRHRRDPFLVRLPDRWLLLLGTGIVDTDGAGRGAVVAYESTDMSSWHDRGVLFADPGGGPLASGPVWECPQLIRLGDRWVLIVSVQGRGGPEPICLGAIWFAGDLVGTTFRADASGRVDGGDVLYAPAVLAESSGRHLAWAWLQDPAPDLSGDDVVGALSLPRVVDFDGERLTSQLPPELDRLAAGDAVRVDEVRVAPGAHNELAADGDLGPAYRLTFAVTAEGPGIAGARLATSPDGRRSLVAGIELAARRHRLVVADDVDGRLTVRHAEPLPNGAPATVDVVVDATIVEVFAGGFAIAVRVDRRSLPEDRVALVSTGGGARFHRVRLTRLAPPRVRSTRAVAT